MDEIAEIFIWTVLIEGVASVVALLCCILAFKWHKKVSWLTLGGATIVTTTMFMLLIYGSLLFSPSEWSHNKCSFETILTTLLLLLVFSFVPGMGVTFYCRKRFELREKGTPSQKH